MAFTSSIASPSQIDFDHTLVLRDLVDGALGEHRAFVQTRDLHPELAHEGHVVLDDDDSAVAVDLLEELGGLARLGVGHAGDRFVHEQQLGLLRPPGSPRSRAWASGPSALPTRSHCFWPCASEPAIR